MTEYLLANGTVLTDEDIAQISHEFASESWEGHLERIYHGSAAIAQDPLVTVAVKFQRSMVNAIDEIATNRSDYIRRASSSHTLTPYP